MANMSYCRFQNTLNDLQDCYDHIEDQDNELSEEEQKARKELIQVCRNIVEVDDFHNG